MKSSLAKNFAIAFYRYRMWLEEQQVDADERRALLRNTNHFLAYLTFSDTDFRQAFQKPEVLQHALRVYKRFLRSSMGLSPNKAAAMLASIDHFCEFTALSARASSEKPVEAPTCPSFFPVHLS